jgi:hypothetical protein
MRVEASLGAAALSAAAVFAREARCRRARAWEVARSGWGCPRTRPLLAWAGGRVCAACRLLRRASVVLRVAALPCTYRLRRTAGRRSCSRASDCA